jgi:hypothetical protein
MGRGSGPLSDMTLSAVLRRMKVPAVRHDFHSSLVPVHKRQAFDIIS